MEEKNTHDRTRERKLQEQEGSSKRTRKNHDSDDEGSRKRTRSNHYSDAAGSTRGTRKNHDSDAVRSRYGTRKNHYHHHDYDADGSTKRTGKNHHDEWSTKGKRKNHDSDAEASMKETRKNYHYYDAKSSTGRTRRNHHDYDAEGSRKETGKNYHYYDAESSTRRTRRNNHDYDAEGSRKETGKNHDYDAESSMRRTRRNHRDYDVEGSTKETGKNYHDYDAEGSRKGTRKSRHAHDARRGTGKNQDSDAAESTKGTIKNQDSDVSISRTSDDRSNQRQDDHVGGGRAYYDREQRYDSFKRVYYCYPLSFVEDIADMGTGNKIIMPEAALMPLMETRITMPMLFEIQNNSTGKVSHCGVLQFTGMEAEAIFLPEWMMKNLELELGDSVTLRNKSLEKGKKIKLQPHTMDFLAIKDPKAALESNLQNFCCLTAGDTIMITHECKSFYINVLETEPGYAICITDTDCEVDFAPPLDYKEPEKSPVKKELATTEQPKFQPFKRQLQGEPSTQGVEEKEKQKFVSFMGKSNRLGGGAWKQEEWNTHPKFEGLDEESSTVWPEEQEKQTKQVKFIPFTGSSRRLDGESVSASSSIPMTDKQPTTVAGGISMAVKPMFKPFMGFSRRLDSA
ncbi:hypothetical protein SLEP1_g35243 [Rubroshorea leprosula]|uniref:Ubiquitin fusion degradaton protein n=1 Tax=Rubroshorea leprosula TaxID=152421 RepID=A0AAV5KML5_9ROSI|nr:hypothetical protein SLEP1_g35243 [Rubroshorea leprosula]